MHMVVQELLRQYVLRLVDKNQQGTASLLGQQPHPQSSLLNLPKSQNARTTLAAMF